MALRHAFVSMLFALVIAEIAIQASNLVAVASNEWATKSVLTVLRDVPSPGGWLMLAPMSHLLLVFVLISMSWVGWSRSIERGGSRDIHQIFSIPFLLLLIELLLVVLYFILARSVELHTKDAPPVTISRPSSIPEAWWITVIFLGYVIWDIFNDALPRYYPKDKRPLAGNPFLSWLIVLAFGFVARCWVSLVCAGAACLVLWRSGSPSQTPLQVVFADLALLCVVVWFWMAKSWEPLVENLIPWEKNRERGRHFEESSIALRASAVVLIPIYILFLALM